jgi:hypothetical protein
MTSWVLLLDLNDEITLIEKDNDEKDLLLIK